MYMKDGRVARWDCTGHGMTGKEMYVSTYNFLFT